MTDTMMDAVNETVTVSDDVQPTAAELELARDLGVRVNHDAWGLSWQPLLYSHAQGRWPWTSTGPWGC
jgi:hypothetical protein